MQQGESVSLMVQPSCGDELEHLGGTDPSKGSEHPWLNTQYANTHIYANTSIGIVCHTNKFVVIGQGLLSSSVCSIITHVMNTNIKQA